MSDLIQRVEHNIVTRNLLRSRQTLLVGVSGGVDSVVLLHILHLLSKRYHWNVLVGHFNHQLRGRSSDGDERFVRRLARRLGRLALTERADVKSFATRQGVSIEMAARRLRHEFLADTARKRKIGTVALAHQADDQIELFFLRLLRGSGAEGLAGMKWSSRSPADSTIQLIRPLLDISRTELEKFALEQKLGFRTDATNADLNHTRNRVRHKVLPTLRRNFPGPVDRTVLRSMEIIGVESDFVSEAARTWLESTRPSEFAQLHAAVQRRALQVQLLARGIVPDFELIEHLRTKVGMPLMIAPTRRLWRGRDGLIFEQKGGATPEFDRHEISVSLKGRSGDFVFDGCAISWRIRPAGNGPMLSRPPSRKCEYFDSERVGPVLQVRHWNPGDRFRPMGRSGSVKLQDWFTNQKVPRHVRHTLVLAETGQEKIFWVEGMRIGDDFKITKKTREVLEWRWSRD